MKPLFILFTLACSMQQVSAQRDDLEKNLNLHFKDSIGISINLPDLNQPELYDYYSQFPGELKIRDTAQFYQLFKKFSRNKLPVIDFSKYDLLPRRVCEWCIRVCYKYGEILQPCHRQACHYILRWWLVEKKTGRINTD